MVQEAFDLESKEKKRNVCTCHQCKMDVSCFVLNRTPPQYIVSERGYAHKDGDLYNRVQKEADIMSLVVEGLELVASKKRPHFIHGNKDETAEPDGLYFHFPIIRGRVFHGLDFSPLEGCTITITQDGKNLEMMEPSWTNPYIIWEGSDEYHFWPRSVPADHLGESKHVELKLILEHESSETLTHHMKLDVVSGNHYSRTLNTVSTLRIEDLYLFPEED